jgi:dTDP-4-amino-4,6-dideoxygalactose transaminase
MIRIAQPIIGPQEEAAVLRVLRSGQLAQGATVTEFEARIASYLGVHHAIAVSSGTAALIVALQAHGIGQGDEVIVPVFTFAATANAVLLVGAKPIFVDVDHESFNIDAGQVKEALTSRSKAIIPVHLFGQACDMGSIMALAEEHDLVVIEDACQALGARWQGQKAGTFSTACLSFYATKSLTTGEGGMVVTSDAGVAEQARLIRNQGETIRYRTDVLGQNYRMTEVAAALGLAQVNHLDDWITSRRANAVWLSDHLDGVAPPIAHAACYHTYQQYTVRVPSNQRDALQAALRESEIESAVYYPLCLHQQPLYQGRGYRGAFPIAEGTATEVLSLPVHAGLSQDDLRRIASAVNHELATAGTRHG